jgi:hypothetical protein
MRTTRLRRRPATWVVALLSAGSLALAACGSSAGDSGSSTITFGQLLPFTGTKAFLSTWAPMATRPQSGTSTTMAASWARC